MNQPKKIGIIGSGFISDYHIPALQKAGADIVILCSIKDEEVKQKAARYHILQTTNEYKAVLAREDLDAVLILTPESTHCEIAVAAAHAGKAIFLQKPMARSSEECRLIINAARTEGVPLYVSFMHRYFSEVEYARKLLDQGILGQILTIRQRNATPGATWSPWFFDRKQVGGGAVMQLGVHGIDLLRLLFGEIKSVNANVAQLVRERVMADGTVVYPDNEDYALAIYRFDSGIIAHHEIVYNEVAGTDRFRMEIYGEKGTAWLRTERGLLSYVLAGEPTAWKTPEILQEDFGIRQHRYFLDMLEDKIPFDQSGEDGLRSIEIAEAIYHSAEIQNWTEVGE